MADTLIDLTSALQNYVVAPLNAFGLGGYIFDVQGESMAMLHAEITDHYTEDNKAVQDHIALRPKRITLKGYVGELVYEAPNSGNNPAGLQSVPEKLTVIDAFLPQISAAATQMQEAIQSSPVGSNITLSSSANIFGLVKNLIGVFGESGKQQQAYQFFAACQSQGILMGIQTPWEFLTNMAVESIVTVQSEDSIFISDFSVTFKQIRIAQTQTVTVLSGTGGPASAGGPAGSLPWLQAIKSETNLGANPGATLPDSALPAGQAQIDGAGALKSILGISDIFTGIGGL